MRFDKRPSKKSKSGYTWRVTIEYTDQFGLPKRHAKSGFTTKKEAQIYGIEAEKKLAAGLDLSADKITLDEVFQEWLKITTLAPNTIKSYSRSYRTHIGPVLGMCQIKTLRYPQLQAFFTSMSDHGEGVCRACRAALKAFGSLAVKSGYIESWPIEMVNVSGRPVPKKRDSEYLSKSDFIRICNAELEYSQNAFDGEARRMVLLIGYYAGLRISEIFGLLWDDIDLDRSVIHVRHQIQGTGMNNVEITDILKTSSSAGDVPIPKVLHDELADWRERNPYDYVICNNYGRLLPANSSGELIKGHAKKAGLESIGFHPHMLRHTYVTNLMLSGADIKTVSKLARHASVSITLDVYAEVIGDQKANAVNKAFGSDDMEDTPDLKA